MHSTNKKYLTPRLKTAFVPNSRDNFFEYYSKKSDDILAVLEKLIIFKDDKVYITGGAWRFDYLRYIKDKGYRIIAEFGFNEGPVYEVEKYEEKS